MADKKIIAVVGATGAQGGGLAHAILNDKNSAFSVRALTRKTDSEKAKELKKLGAEVVKADLDDLDSLKKAFAGCYGAFCVTNFWEHFSPEKEFKQASNMAKAAKDAGLKHVVWSTFEDTRKWVPLESNQMPTLQGKYKVPHFDAKGEADNVFRELKVPTTFLYTSFYWDNMIFFGMNPKKGPDGVLAITFPMDDKKLPGMFSGDIGKCAYGIFKEGTTLVGKTVGIAGEHLTGTEMAATMTRVLGKEIRYNAVTPDTYRAFGFPGADDLGSMFQFKRDFQKDYLGVRDLKFSRKMNPELLTFEQWLTENKSRIPLG